MKKSINSNIFKHSLFEDPQDCKVGEAENLHDLFIQTVKKYGEKDFLGKITNGKIDYLTYEEAYYISRNYAEQLKPLIDENKIVGILSTNRREWFFTEQAIYMNSAIICPLYVTLGTPSLVHIIQEAELKTIYTSNEGLEQIKLILESTKKPENSKQPAEKKTLGIENLICYDEVSEELMKFFTMQGIKVEPVTQKTEKFAVEKSSNTKPDDLSTICYTSGTTGKPKGALITHKCFMSQLKVLSDPNNDFFRLSSEDVYFSYLPLAHVMERICTQALIFFGGRVGIYTGDVKKIAEDLSIVQPSFIAGVPRVFNVFKDKIFESVNKKNFFVRKLFNYALKYKIRRQLEGKYTSRLFDWLVFRKVQKKFGGNLRHALSGSAPLNPEVCKFIQAVFSMKICEGYGSTEGTAANILKPLYVHTCGTVGIPFPSNKVKLVPTKKFKDANEGEIYLKGENIFKGYHKREKETKEVLEDGWVKTGDIGRVDKDGLFEIVGRSKEIFKLPIGEYIIPEKLEKIYQNVAEDIFITNVEYKDFIVAVVVSTESTEKIMKKINKIAEVEFKKGVIKKFEIPRKIVVSNENFVTLGLLTPTNKKIRTKIFEKFEEEIKKLYE